MAASGLLYRFQIPETDSEHSVATATAARVAEDLRLDRDGASPDLREKVQPTVALGVMTRSRVQSHADRDTNKRVSFASWPRLVETREYLPEGEEAAGLAPTLGEAGSPRPALLLK